MECYIVHLQPTLFLVCEKTRQPLHKGTGLEGDGRPCGLWRYTCECTCRLWNVLEGRGSAAKYMGCFRLGIFVKVVCARD